MTTVYGPLSITGNDNGNGGYSFRNKRLTSASNLGQVRVTISTDTSIGTLVVNNVGIGKWAGTNADTTTTPESLLFGGSAGFTITTTPNGTVTSDWLTPTGFTWTSGDTLVVIVDMGATGDCGTGVFVTGNDVYYHSATASYNVAAPAAYTQFNESALVTLIETQVGGGGSPTDDRAFQSGAMQTITLMRERVSGLLEPVRELWKPKRPKLIVPGFAF